MSIVSCNMSVSIDGYISGPEHLDHGFDRVQDWVHRIFASRDRHDSEGGARNVDSELFEALYADVGAYVMGRALFDTGEEAWGHDPPFHAPVYVVTHRPRPALERDGGTSFHFVTRGGTPEAVAQARAAAGGKDVHICGGGKIVSQALAADLIDELHLHVSPVLLGAGMRLFDGLAKPINFEIAAVVESPYVTHLRYRRTWSGLTRALFIGCFDGA